MSINIARGPLTDLLITTLRQSLDDLPVGDGEAPLEPHGWQGQVNAPGSEFIPYVALMPMTSGTPMGSLGDSASDWQLPYQLQAFGVARNQCEWMADHARGVLAALRGTKVQLGPDRYGVQQVRLMTLGGITRLDVTDPPYYGQADGMSVWLTKG